MKKRFILFLISFLFLTKCFAQTINVGDYAETLARMNQLTGVSDDISSFCVRPINSAFNSIGDSTIRYMAGSKNMVPQAKLFGAQVIVRVLPFSWISDYNSKLPFGDNNGSLYPNVGYQTMATGGIYVKAGILRIQFKPELVYAQNKPFPTFADLQKNDKSNLIPIYFGIINNTDAPERFGNQSISHAYWGQSKITLVFKDVEAGISTENIWWGPGVENSIMMSNSAPGFLHWTFNSANPIKTGIGSFEWQLIGGILKPSGFPPYNLDKFKYYPNLYAPEPGSERYLSAFTGNWQPRFIPGLYLGVSGTNYRDKDSTWSRKSLIGRLIPVLDPSSRTTSGAGQKFAYSGYIRQVLPKYHAELYFEYARNDDAAGLTDFFLEPEHATAYTLGAARIFDFNNKQHLQVRIESTHLQIPDTFLLRPEPSWYVHAGDPQVEGGYTNQGRYVGAGIGPGSNSVTLDLSYIENLNSFGVKLERLSHNNDLYYLANQGVAQGLEPLSGSQWDDVSSTFYAKFTYRKYLFTMEYSPISTSNYEYITGNNIFNNNVRIEFTYFF